MKQAQNYITVSEHLYQIYPNLPKYANDPEQSDIIRVYDLLLKRFQGIYGRQPKYFIRSPASCVLFGIQSQSVKLPLVTFCSLQNVIICVTENGHKQIRFNHYQTAVYGQNIFENQSTKWKYDNNDDYRNLLISCLKSYCSISNNQNLTGLDILVYDDFVQDQHLKWRQSLCCGIITALILLNQNKSSFQSLTPQFYYKFLTKISNFVSNIRPNSFSSLAQYGNVNIVDTESPCESKSIEFPKNIDIVIAHSMTPLPKKMTKGKRENLRACQIQIGIQIIKNQIGATSNISSLNELKKYLNCTTQELLDTLEQYVPKGELTIEKVEQLTEKSLIENVKSIPYANNVIDENLTFKPYNRMKFCIEQQLIIQKLTSENLDSSIQKSYLLSKELLDIGSQQFDDIINVASKYSSTWKVIGQGWGGYLLIFCQTNKSKHLVDQLVKQFYMAEKNRVLLSDDVEQYVKIVGKPANGIKILDPQSEIWYC